MDNEKPDPSSSDPAQPSSSTALVPAKPAGPLLIPRKLGKNPDVDTSFLRDHEREEQENELREELRLEWEQRQEALKNEEIEITFSYWDGSGHRRSLRMKKGESRCRMGGFRAHEAGAVPVQEGGGWPVHVPSRTIFNITSMAVHGRK